MLGCVLGKRRCEWFANTSMILGHVFRSNTNLQTNYRMPICVHTHDKDCKRATCISDDNARKILLLTQRAMKQMTGYFGGYICKKQKVGQFELKRSIDALPLLKEKLASRTLNAGHQLAHVCNRFFSVLESKGILRTATEEFLLASRYRPDDPLNAEFVRTFRHEFFYGVKYLQKYDELKAKEQSISKQMYVPKASSLTMEYDAAALYGYRAQDPRLIVLAPWFFVQHWHPHRLQKPTATYNLTKWTKDGCQFQITSPQ